MSGAKSIILDLAREDSLPWLFFWLAVLKMFVCIAVPFRLNHVIVAGDGNEQVGIKLSDNLTGHLMLGHDGLQIFIICFQAIDIDNLIDYLIFSDIIFNVDGWTFNWQWTTYDGVKWWINVYDLDRSFGRCYDNVVHDGSAEDPTYPNKPHCQANMWAPYLINYYTPELEERWAELRRSGIVDAKHLTDILNDWIGRVGYDNYEKEYDKWGINTTFYADSPMRVYLWIQRKIKSLDQIYNYE